MVLLLREMARNRKSFIIWITSMVLLNIMMMSFYPTIADQAQKFDELLQQYPKAFIEAFSLDKLNMSEILGYYSMEAYVFVTLFGSIYAMLLAASILSKEESEKTVEFLMSKPVTRNYIVTAKLLSMTIYIVLFNLILALVNFALFEVFKKDEYSMKGFLLISVAPLLMHLTFAAIGFFISIFIVKAKAVYPVALGVVLGTYFLSIASDLTEKLENLKYFTPFKYVNAGDLITNERIEWIYLVIMLAAVIVSILATYIGYSKKDITV